MSAKMSSFGIGVDVEQIDRFIKFRYDTQDAFLRRVYTQKEIRYCFSKKNSAQHLAARFVGKEAVRKSLQGMMKLLPAFTAIEILPKANGAPSVVLRGKGATAVHVQVSLSHSGTYAVAFAIAQKL